MHHRPRHEDRARENPAPALRHGHGTEVLEDTRDDDAELGPETSSVAVFPAPLTTMAAGAAGSLLGFVAIYLLVTFNVDPLVGAGVILVLFALALSGPKMLADARTEGRRAVAVVLDGIAFGGTLGGLAVLLVF